MRVCEVELHQFEECRHDPVRFAKFKALATPVQAADPKVYFTTKSKKNYFF